VASAKTMKPITVFYHCLFMHGSPPELKASAFSIVHEQMSRLQDSGLADAATELIVGINGPVEESKSYAAMLIPPKAKLVFHGPDSFAENLTLVEIEKWVPHHPGWNVLYFHAKGCTHDLGTPYSDFSARWRSCMTESLIYGWERCVKDLDRGFEAVGCHWLTGQGHDKSQHYFAGNFWWAKSEFLATLPSIYKRERIKTSGIAAAESRYEAEVYIGNGPRLPVIRDYATHGLMACP
jgi:hypothetical protein